MSERFFRSNRPGYPHPVSSELENSGIRAAIGDCSVTERRRWRPPYQTGKALHVHAKHYKHNKDGHTAPSVCGSGSVPLSHSENVVTRIGIHTHTNFEDTPDTNNLYQMPFLYIRSNAFLKSTKAQYIFLFSVVIIFWIIECNMKTQSTELLPCLKPNCISVKTS